MPTTYKLPADRILQISGHESNHTIITSQQLTSCQQTENEITVGMDPTTSSSQTSNLQTTSRENKDQ
jgi:hypothetical protein